MCNSYFAQRISGDISKTQIIPTLLRQAGIPTWHRTDRYMNLDFIIEIYINHCSHSITESMASSISLINEYCSDGKISELQRLDENAKLRGYLERSTGCYGYTPLHSAVIWNQESVIKFLLDLNYIENYVNIRASSNRTPLHVAVSFQFAGCVECLIGSNADINVKDEYGKTPIDTAIDNKNEEIINLLKKEST